MRSKKNELYAAQLKLTDVQRELLVGTLLGDAHLESQNSGRTYRLKIEHSFKQKEYVEWLATHFQEWLLTPAHDRMHTSMIRGEQKTHQKFLFNTVGSSAFRFYAQQFYRNRRKIVPSRIARMLAPRALAVWYMDDGSIKSRHHRSAFLNTQGFDDVSIDRLQDALFKTYGIKTTIRKQRDGKQIYLISETAEMFFTLIKPYIIPAMEYKIPKVWLTHVHKM